MIDLASEGFPKESFKLIKKNKKGDDLLQSIHRYVWKTSKGRL